MRRKRESRREKLLYTGDDAERCYGRNFIIMHQRSRYDFSGSQDANCNVGRIRRGKTYELGQIPVYFTHGVTDLEDFDWRILMVL